METSSFSLAAFKLVYLHSFTLLVCLVQVDYCLPLNNSFISNI